MNRYIQWKKNNPSSYKEVLRRRRKRYQKDDEYRQKQLRRASEWREKQNQKKKGKRKRLPRPKLLLINNHQVECWSAGRTADYLGVDKKTVTNLEQRGTIPTNHVVLPNRHRWWPAAFVRWLKPFFDQRKSEISAQEFHRRVWIEWSEEQVRGVIPVISDALLRGDTSDGGEDQEQNVAS